MTNLKLIEDQPHWRVALVALFAKLMGVMVHVEGFPFGSNRSCKHGLAEEMGESDTACGQVVGFP